MTAIFVFGSNLAGIHGAGAALWAKKNRGAVQFVGEGAKGFSYALPTKRTPRETLPIEAIRGHVETFKKFAASHPGRTFQLTPIGCGLAGYTPEDIAPMFADAPPNVRLPDEFRAVLGL